MIFKKIGILDPQGKHLNPLNSKPFTARYAHIAENGDPDLKVHKPGNGWAHFTVYKDRNNFFKNIIENQVVIIVSGTGTGKSVIFPKLLLHYFDYKKTVIMTIPTKKAVESTARYGALCMDVNYKDEIAMRTGDDNHENDPDKTKILYATDGFVSGLISSDEYLDRFHGIIIDEAHTRGTNIDILLRKVTAIAKVRKEFRIIVMSATIDPKPFQTYFDSHNLSNALMEYTGKKSNFPINNDFNTKELSINDLQGQPFLDKINEILLNTEDENILGFVTSENKGESCKKKLYQMIEKNIDKYKNIPWIGVLGGKTPDDEKKKCLGMIPTSELKPGKYGKYKRRVIFATPAIEFSVTFNDNMNHVVESGVSFQVIYDYNLNCNVLKTDFVYKSNIHQRCGRTGRKQPGTCYRMYTKAKYDSFGEFEPPGILRSDIHNEVISLLNMKSIGNFKKCNEYLDSMLSPVPQINKKVIFNSLLEHNIMNTKGELTKIGKFLELIPLNVGFTTKKMLLISYYFNCLPEIMILSSMLQIIKNFNEIFNNKVPDTFKGNNKEKNREEIIIKNKNLKKFNHSSGDHITLINMYQKLMVLEEEEKKIYCEKNNINFKIIKKIDEVFYDLYLNWDEDNKTNINKIFPLIIYGNFFKVENHPTFKKNKLNVDNLILTKPDLIKNIKGGSNKFDYKNLKKKIKVDLEKRTKKKKQIQDKKKSFKKPNNKNVNKKDTKKLYEILQKINLINQEDKKTLKLSDNVNDNILACIFYSNITNIGISSDNQNGYLIKNRNNIDVDLFKSTSVLNLFKNKPEFIVFHSINYSMKNYSLDIVSKIDRKIINMVLDNKI